MKVHHLVFGAAFSLIFLAGSMAAEAENLFNGQDLAGWSYGSSVWTVSDGILKNTGAGNDNDYLHYNTQLAAKPFVMEMSLKMVSHTNDWPRPRIYLNGTNFYFGTEGFARQYEVYGLNNNLTNVQEVGDDAYTLGHWNTLRLEVNSENKVSFFKNGILTHTGVLSQFSPLDIYINAGDGWSGGKIEISSITYQSIPEPATILFLSVGALVLRRRKLIA